MKFVPSENLMWTEVLLCLIWQPMVLARSTRIPLKQVLNGLSFEEGEKIQEGIDAIVSIKLCIMDGSDICKTQKGEIFAAFLTALSASADSVDENAYDHPIITPILEAIERDSRLIPPQEVSKPNRTVAEPTSINHISNSTNTGSVAKIAMVVFAIVLLFGLMKHFS